MDTKSEEIFRLVHGLIPIINQDWNEQRNRGQRTLGFGVHSFDPELQKAYPEINTSGYLKKAKNYHSRTQKDGKPREMELWRVKILAKYLFIDLMVPYG